jgi:multidrug efflux pump subunit AcrA (membrane-fusion protein)
VNISILEGKTTSERVVFVWRIIALAALCLGVLVGRFFIPYQYSVILTPQQHAEQAKLRANADAVARAEADKLAYATQQQRLEQQKAESEKLQKAAEEVEKKRVAEATATAKRQAEEQAKLAQTLLQKQERDSLSQSVLHSQQLILAAEVGDFITSTGITYVVQAKSWSEIQLRGCALASMTSTTDRHDVRILRFQRDALTSSPEKLSNSQHESLRPFTKRIERKAEEAGKVALQCVEQFR